MSCKATSASVPTQKQRDATGNSTIDRGVKGPQKNAVWNGGGQQKRKACYVDPRMENIYRIVEEFEMAVGAGKKIERKTPIVILGNSKQCKRRRKGGFSIWQCAMELLWRPTLECGGCSWDDIGWYRWKQGHKEGKHFNRDGTGLLVTRIRELKRMQMSVPGPVWKEGPDGGPKVLSEMKECAKPVPVQFQFSGGGGSLAMDVNADYRRTTKYDHLLVLIVCWCNEPIPLVPGLTHHDIQYGAGMCDTASKNLAEGSHFGQEGVVTSVGNHADYETLENGRVASICRYANYGGRMATLLDTIASSYNESVRLHLTRQIGGNLVRDGSSNVEAAAAYIRRTWDGATKGVMDTVTETYTPIHSFCINARTRILHREKDCSYTLIVVPDTSGWTLTRRQLAFYRPSFISDSAAAAEPEERREW